MRISSWVGTVVSAWIVQAGVVAAHPGHGVTESGTPAHYVLEPQHGWWVILVLMGGAALLIRRQLRQSRKQHAPGLARHSEAGSNSSNE